jgi:hypothetical protein
MSGRLFDVPFQSSEAAPLRRRENDSFASPSRYFTMQDAADFSTMRRRKRDDQWIVKMAMRAVLLSPVIVLVIWSIASVAFAHRQIQQNNNYGSNNQRMQQQPTTRRQWLIPRRMYQQNIGSPLIVQPKNFPNQRMSNTYNMNNNENNIEPPNVIPVLPTGQYYENGQPLIQLPPQQQPFPEQGAQYYYEFPQEQARPRGVPLPEFPEQQAQYYYEFPEQQQRQDPRAAALDLPEQQAKQYYYEFPQEAMADTPGLPDAPMQAEAQPALGRTQQHSNLRPKNQGVKSSHNNNNKVLYYYYNPKDTARDRNGNLFLPSVVYDSNGRPIELQSLHANQVLIEPPSSMIHHNISANATILNITYHHPDTFDGRVYDNKRGMAMPDWGQSTKTDSSIILCTVGVMALLVGAVSARNMRSRSFLSVCIENEALEDDAAYDTAYTVTNNHYNTFAQGWKGDLEKFDV